MAGKKKKGKVKVEHMDSRFGGGILAIGDRVAKRLHPDSLWDDVRYHANFFKYSVPSVWIKNRLPFFTIICGIISLATSLRNLAGEEWMIHRGFRWDIDALVVHSELGSTTTFGMHRYCEFNATYSRCLTHHQSKDKASTCYRQDHAAGCVQFSSTKGAAKMPYCRAVEAMCGFKGEKSLLMIWGQMCGCAVMVLVAFLLAFEITGWRPSHFRNGFIRTHCPNATGTKSSQLRANKAWEGFRKKRLMWLVGLSKVVCIWTAMCGILGTMLWGLVHFKFRQAFKCSPTDTRPTCPVYGEDFIRMIATMCVNTLGSGVMLLVKKRFKRRHEDQIHKLRKADFGAGVEDEVDADGNPVKRKLKTRLALVQEFNEFEDQTEASIMIQALARGYIVRVRVGMARKQGLSGYIGGAIFAGLSTAAQHGRRATARAAKAMGFVPGGAHVARGIGGLTGGLVGGVRGMLGGVAGGLGVLGGGLGIIPKSKRRKRDPSRGGTVPPPPGAGDVLFPVYPLDPFSTEELMQPGAQYGNVSHFTAEVELGLRGRDVVVMGVRAAEEGGAAAAPPPPELLAEWPLSQVANVSAQKDDDPEMMEMLELEIKHLGMFLFEADKAEPIAALISRRAGEASAAKGSAASGGGGSSGSSSGGSSGSGSGGVLGGVMDGVSKAKGALTNAGTAAGKGVRLWV